MIRVLTSAKSNAYGSKFSKAKVDTVWNKIFRSNMDDSSFSSSEESLQIMLSTDDLLTTYSSVESMSYHAKDNCLLRFLWKSPRKTLESFAFPKKSPLLPFFNHVTKKIRENGYWSRLKQKWQTDTKICQIQEENRPISISKIVSVIALLIFAMILSVALLVCELFSKCSTVKLTKLIFRPTDIQ